MKITIRDLRRLLREALVSSEQPTQLFFRSHGESAMGGVSIELYNVSDRAEFRQIVQAASQLDPFDAVANQELDELQIRLDKLLHLVARVSLDEDLETLESQLRALVTKCKDGAIFGAGQHPFDPEANFWDDPSGEVVSTYINIVMTACLEGDDVLDVEGTFDDAEIAASDGIKW